MLYDFNNNNEKFGKKGDVLRELHNLLSNEDCVHVPDTLVLSLDFFNKLLKNRLLENQEVLTISEKKEILFDIRKRFQNKKIVVRSSASCEDSILFTNSGQYDSFLNLSSDEEILNAINKTLNSFLSPNALEYYKINNINLSNHGMAVLIQEVAPVKQAGVMFTANPITGRRAPIIEFCDGLGENVVSGQKDVTTIIDKYKYIPEVLKKLILVGNKIEKEKGCPQDIEWGIDDSNNIYIFQSRPIIINERNIERIQELDIPKNNIIGTSISQGFTIGKIKDLDNGCDSDILLQNGKLTSKDLSSIINNKAILLKTGGYLSHFANIIREFNKPSMIINPQQIFLDKIYVIDGYNESIYSIDDLPKEQRKMAYWNYFTDLVCNGNNTYLNNIGVSNYCFYKKDNENILENSDFMIVENELYIDSKKNEILKIEFSSLYSLNNFIEKCTSGDKVYEKVYRR